MVKLIESPRDAWQGLPGQLPAEVKADYLRLLIGAGFRHLDAVSFVAKAAIPERSDSERVLEFLDAPADVEIIALCLDEQGAGRAIKTGAITTLAFPYSISPGYLQRNQNQTPEESLEALEAVGTVAFKAGLDVVAYLTMAFGNPYGDAWSIEEVVDACDLLSDCGVTQISLIDTLGRATPKLVADVVTDVLAVHDRIEVGVHLHGTRETAEALILSAYRAGCRRFDTALGGLGDCPPAQDALVGNLSTATVLSVLQSAGAELPEITGLDQLVHASAEIARKYGQRVQ